MVRQKADKASSKQEWQLGLIRQLSTKLRYVPGDENVVSDVLSCVAAIGMSRTIIPGKLLKTLHAKQLQFHNFQLKDGIFIYYDI